LKGLLKMDISEFFDVYNYDHLTAYKTREKTGCWPEDFIPLNITFSPCWDIHLQAKMANAWLIHNDVCFSLNKQYKMDAW